MENKFNQFVNNNKGFVVFYLVWLLLHIILLIAGRGYTGFWPITSGYNPNAIGTVYDDSGIVNYGITEFFFYLILPVILWALWKLVGNDIKKKIDENN